MLDNSSSPNYSRSFFFCKGTTFSRNGSIKSSFRAQFKQFLSKVTPTYNKKERFLGKIRYLCQQIRRRWNKNSTITLWACKLCGSFASGRVRRLLTARVTNWSERVTPHRVSLPYCRCAEPSGHTPLLRENGFRYLIADERLEAKYMGIGVGRLPLNTRLMYFDLLKLNVNDN